MLPHEAGDARAPDLDAMIGRQAVGHLLVREVAPRDGSVHGRTGRVRLQHLATGRAPRGEQRMPRLAAATCSREARVLQGLGSGECLHPLGNRMSVTAEEARDSPEATTPERAGCARGLAAPVFC
jgi:hypothetical protein